MLTVIFGAGASYDSDPRKTPGDSDLDRPPLGDELFNYGTTFNIVSARYRQIAAIVTRIRSDVKSGISVETVLANLQSEASEYPLVTNQLMAVRFYLRDLIDETATDWSKGCSGATTYAEFVNRLARWSYVERKFVNYITFNYDFLLEEALMNLSSSFTEMEDYIPVQRIGSPNVIRPHGCVRWNQVMSSTKQIRSNSPADEIIRISGTLENTDDFFMRDLFSPKVPDLGSNHTLVPAIAIPTDDKQDYTCPERHVNTMRDIMKATKLFLIVGWRGNDPHFAADLQTFSSGATRTIVCNGSYEEGGSTIRRLGRSNAHTPQEGLGFSELLTSSYLDEVLRHAANLSN